MALRLRSTALARSALGPAHALSFLPPTAGGSAPQTTTARRTTRATAGGRRASASSPPAPAPAPGPSSGKQPSQASSSSPSPGPSSAPPNPSAAPKQASSHGHSGHSHAHAHSHSLNPFASHSHSHAHNVPSPTALRDALTGKGDRGSRVTLYGLASNVGLTAVKLVAGWRFNSASLLAEAGHSASDLLGDLVTLFCYNMSRRPPTKLFPHGLGKFDAVGMWTVSAILVLGSVGIGLHSYNLLTLVPFPESNPLSSLPHLPSFLPSHSHSHAIDIDEHGHVLDPNAAWIAAVSVGVKEWMFRLTKKVGEEEGSSVLLANALHHRSDALTSFIALLSILGSHAGLPVLDPLGGLLVSLLLLKQSGAMIYRSSLDLLDASCDDAVLDDVRAVLDDLVDEAREAGTAAWAVKSVKGMNGGAGARVEVEIVFSRAENAGAGVGLAEAERIGRLVEDRCKEAEGVNQVRVFFTEAGADDAPSDHDDGHGHGLGGR